MRFLAPLFLMTVLVAAAPAGAKWAHVPTETLLADSDFVVEATLKHVKEHTQKGRDYGQGVLEVRRVWRGAARSGEKLALRWDNDSRIACPRVEWKHTEGTAYVWLLKRGEKGTVRADYPGRAVDLKELPKLQRLLERRSIHSSVK